MDFQSQQMIAILNVHNEYMNMNEENAQINVEELEVEATEQK